MIETFPTADAADTEYDAITSSAAGLPEELSVLASASLLAEQLELDVATAWEFFDLLPEVDFIDYPVPPDEAEGGFVEEASPFGAAPTGGEGEGPGGRIEYYPLTAGLGITVVPDDLPRDQREFKAIVQQFAPWVIELDITRKGELELSDWKRKYTIESFDQYADRSGIVDYKQIAKLIAKREGPLPEPPRRSLDFGGPRTSREPASDPGEAAQPRRLPDMNNRQVAELLGVISPQKTEEENELSRNLVRQKMLVLRAIRLSLELNQFDPRVYDNDELQESLRVVIERADGIFTPEARRAIYQYERKGVHATSSPFENRFEPFQGIKLLGDIRKDEVLSAAEFDWANRIMDAVEKEIDRRRAVRAARDFDPTPISSLVEIAEGVGSNNPDMIRNGAIGVGLSFGSYFLLRGLRVAPEIRGSGNTADGIAPVGPTLPNTTRGWRVGQPINNLTASGNVPSWSAVRQRFWKNEAHFNAGNYNADNLARMQRGLAPQRVNPRTGQLESMELHHTPPQRDGGLFDVRPVWPDDHALIDPFRRTGN